MKRYTDPELLDLLNNGESDRVEFKQNCQDATVREKVSQAICAFANDLPNNNQPGCVFIGVKDDGSPTPLVVTDQLLLQLAAIRDSGNIIPLPTFTVQKRTLKGAEMAVITVMPSDMPPLRYKGRVIIRTGSRRAIASAQDERVLIEKRRSKHIPYDIYPIPSASLSDLSRSLFENEYLPAAVATDVLEANDRTYEQQLASCNMIVSPSDPTPTLLGLLAIGKNPQDYIPAAGILFLRLNGTELTDPIIDQQAFGGTFVDRLYRVNEKLEAHNRSPLEAASAPTHAISWDYPMRAIQQLLYNAVLHRSYEANNAPVLVYWFSDRIEITSPGGPYGNVTVDNFGTPGITSYRNPNIAAVLKTFGFIQAFGRGIAIARKALQDNGNPALELEVNHSIVMAVLRRKQ